MSNDSIDTETQIRLFREQIAQLISENLDLNRQLEDLKQQRADIPVESIAAAAIRSVRSAERTIAEQVPEGNRYIMPQLQTSLRGFVLQSAGALALRLPFPEHAVPSDLLGTLDMTIAQVPPAMPALPPGVFAPTTPLVAALENAQNMFARWKLRRGAIASRRFVDGVTQLLSMQPFWNLNDLRFALEILADVVTSLAKSLSGHVAVKAIQACHNA